MHGEGFTVGNWAKSGKSPKRIPNSGEMICCTALLNKQHGFLRIWDSYGYALCMLEYFMNTDSRTLRIYNLYGLLQINTDILITF